MLVEDKYSKAMANGYYFDRCIDLVFYDENFKILYRLSTPIKGIKPSILVKGTLVAGSQAISSYVSISNMSYSIDVKNVAYLGVRMYYSGHEEAYATFSKSTANALGGMSVVYKVQYADQEKEPPNRAVRFQCTTAEQASKFFNIPLKVENGGIGLDDGTKLQVSGEDGKSGSALTSTLFETLKKIAEMRNAAIDRMGIGTGANYVKVSSIDMPEELKDTPIKIRKGRYSYGGLLRRMSGYTLPNKNDENFCDITVVPFKQKLIVLQVAPADWEKRAEKAGATTDEEKNAFFIKQYKKPFTSYSVGTSSTGALSGNPLGSEDNPVPLNFVLAAYRSEVNVHITTLFDERLSVLSYCKIKANAIMGKASVGKRLNTKFIGEDGTVIIKIDTRINFTFGTTEGGTMDIVGVIVREEGGEEAAK